MPTLRVAPSIKGAVATIDAVADSGFRTSIFYEFSGALTPHADGLGDAALLAFLPCAMRQGLDIKVEAAVDAGLLRQLEEAQDAWLRWSPDMYRRVAIDAAETIPDALPADQTAVVAFSGGLDSTFSLHAHKRGLMGRRTLDIRAGVLGHGLDIPLEQPGWFENARVRAKAILDHYDVPLTVVRTNLRCVDIPWGQYFIFATTSMLHLFKGHVSAGTIAPDQVYDQEILGWGSNSVTNQMMSGPSFPIRFTGGGWTRTEKAGALCGEAPALANLRVCWEHPESPTNCGACEKCVRTKLNFMANGVEDFPALGAPVTVQQILDAPIYEEIALNFLRELALYPWTDRPDIKAALLKRIERGLKERGLRRHVAKYKRSLKKRGLWPG